MNCLVFGILCISCCHNSELLVSAAHRVSNHPTGAGSGPSNPTSFFSCLVSSLCHPFLLLTIKHAHTHTPPAHSNLNARAQSDPKSPLYSFTLSFLHWFTRSVIHSPHCACTLEAGLWWEGRKGGMKRLWDRREEKGGRGWIRAWGRWGGEEKKALKRTE